MSANNTAPSGFIGKFTVLRGAARELWITFLLKWLGVLAYALVNSTLVLWLSYDLGYDDVAAGYLVFGWASALTFFSVLAGSLTDAIGLRKTFLLGISTCVFARVVLTFTTVKWLAIFFGLLPLAIGEALVTPVFVAAVHRYSTTLQRSISFSISYALMNVGFFLANLIFDFARKHLGEPHGHWTLAHGLQLTTYQTIFFASLVIEAALLPIVYFGIRSGVEATDSGIKVTPKKVKYPNQKLFAAMRLAARDTLRESARIFAGLWRQPGFYKFLAFLGFAAFARIVMTHMYYTYPKFGVRELGPGAPIGRLWGINQLLIIFLVPLVGALTQRISAYRMATIGTTIAAASVFLMAMPPVWFTPLANGPLGGWLGHWYLGITGTVNPYYVMIFFFVTMLSIGEAFYSPRLYEYAAAIAPKGQEASYMAISYVPFFLAKLLVASSSGFLLERFCPESGPRNSQMLWLIIALTTTIAPIGLIALKRFIRVHEAGRSG